MKIYVDGQYIDPQEATLEQKLKIMQQRPLLYQELYNLIPPTLPRARGFEKYQIYQIFYNAISEAKCDKGFIPYDNSGVTHNFENDVILDLWISRRMEWINKKYVGVFSWRFYEKTLMTANDLYRQLEKTDADVVIISPKLYAGQKHPYVREGFGSVTAMCRIADEQKLFPFTLSEYPVETIAWCNYWVARPEVFDLYCTKYLNKVITFFRDNRNKNIHELYDAKVKHRQGSDYFAMTFFLEGLFSIFIKEEKLKIYDYTKTDL